MVFKKGNGSPRRKASSPAQNTEGKKRPRRALSPFELAMRKAAEAQDAPSAASKPRTRAPKPTATAVSAGKSRRKNTAAPPPDPNIEAQPSTIGPEFSSIEAHRSSMGPEAHPSTTRPEVSSIEPQLSIIESYAETGDAPQAAEPRRKSRLLGSGVALAATVLVGVSGWWLVNSDSLTPLPAVSGKAPVSTPSSNRQIAAAPRPAGGVAPAADHRRDETSQMAGDAAAALRPKISALPQPTEAPRAAAGTPQTKPDAKASTGIPAGPEPALKPAAVVPPPTVAAKPSAAPVKAAARAAEAPKAATVQIPIKLQIVPQSLTIAATVPPLLQASPDVVSAPSRNITAEVATKPTERAPVSTASPSSPDDARIDADKAAAPKVDVQRIAAPDRIELETLPQSVIIATTVPPLLRANPPRIAAPKPNVAAVPTAKPAEVKSPATTEPASPATSKVALGQSLNTSIDTNKAEPSAAPAQSIAVKVPKTMPAAIAPEAVKLEAVPQALIIAGTVPPLLRVKPDPVATSEPQITATTPAPAPPIQPSASTSLRIVMHYSSPDAGQRAAKSREALIAKGISEVELRKVSKRIPRDELRYFHPADQQNAMSLSSAGAGLERFGVYSLAGKGFRAPSGLVEVWLRGNDNVAAPKKTKVAVPRAKPLPRRAATYSSQPTVEPAVEELQVIRRIPNNGRRGRYLGRPPGAPLVPSPRAGWSTCDC